MPPLTLPAHVCSISMFQAFIHKEFYCWFQQLKVYLLLTHVPHLLNSCHHTVYQKCSHSCTKSTYIQSSQSAEKSRLRKWQMTFLLNNANGLQNWARHCESNFLRALLWLGTGDVVWLAILQYRMVQHAPHTVATRNRSSQRHATQIGMLV